MIKNICLAFLVFSCVFSGHAQVQQEYSSAELYKKIEKLNFLGSVLYVAAHPDDENTAMISYLSNKVNARVAYLALNRGDGGQNLLGTEIREQLGVIRTQELLEARKIDHAEQFFTRANDFGFSKNPTETFQIWNKDDVLSDVVWIFRKFRPDVVINRFNHRTAGDTHGHHTASAILSTEAFNLSGNQTQFSDQLNYVDTWQPKRSYYNDSWFFYGCKEKYLAANHDDFLKVDVGVYLPLLGKSNTEISALSRSQHKSQGFGMSGERGKEMDFFEPIQGDLSDADKNIFAGIDTTWNRVEGGKPIGNILRRVQNEFDFKAPQNSIPLLLEAYQLIDQLKDPYWKNLKSQQIKEIITGASGLFLEASVADEWLTLGKETQINFEAVNRSDTDVQLLQIEIPELKNKVMKLNLQLVDNQEMIKSEDILIPQNLPYSSPYWLEKPHTDGMYTVESQKLRGLPNTPPQLSAVFHLMINGVPLQIKRTIVYKTTTQIQGEIRQPLAIVPDASVKMRNKVLVFPNNGSKTIRAEVKSYKDNLSGKLHLKYAEGWKVEPQNVNIDIKSAGQKQVARFKITPPENQSEAYLQPILEAGNKQFDKELKIIDYPHIPRQTILMPTQTKLNKIDIKIAGRNIGYIRGAGDEIPQALREIGYRVTMLSGADLNLDDLKQFDAVVTGIRAYNSNNNLVVNQKTLFEYVKQGGTLITQYSQLMGIKTKKIAPYPMTLSHDRVTDENADVRFLEPKHPVLNFPNTITQKDFEGWQQERGLYFPSSWDKNFTPILGMHDLGEKELQGSLLIAKYGKGCYVYTGLSFFRELPAGVPGAYRLFANILAL